MDKNLNRRDFLGFIGSGIAAMMMPGSVGLANKGKKPNFIIIFADDLGYGDISGFGFKKSPFETPNLEQMAAEGAKLTSYYVPTPYCAPSRATILTGRYPFRNGVVFNPAPDGGINSVGLPDSEITIAEALKENGYATAHIGKWHLAHKSKHYADHQGFDFVIGGAHLPGPRDYYSPYKNAIRNLKAGPKGEYLNERLAKESIKWIQSVKGKPFFLNFWHYAVHGPIIAKKDLLPKYKKLRDSKADQRCPEMATMLESMDNSIGMLLDWLDKPENKKIKDNTLIIMTSDNGGVTHKAIGENTWTSNRPLRGGKANTYEGGFREPWIVRWPQKTKPGSVCGTTVQSIDIYPTVLEAVGLQPKKGVTLDGQSIVPLLTGKAMKHQPIFTDFPHLFGIMCAPSSSVRVGDFKLIRYFHAGKNTASHGYELFDLKRDPYESIDLASFLPEKVKTLDKLIEAHLKKTQALTPLPNTEFKGSPRRRRSSPKMAPNRPQKLRLATSTISAKKAGSRRIQLLDEKGKPRNTHALVLEGDDWVRINTNPDGSVEVVWDEPGKKATVLFGWKGGSTCFEINDWTIPPTKLVLKRGT